jgi:transcriptional regulator
MYVSKLNHNSDSGEIKNFIRENGFGILINHTHGKLWGTHLPMEFSEDETKLIGHVSKANPQWKNFNNDDEVLSIFTGPHTYISSSWYNHENVPTWNYIAAHVYGKIEIIEGDRLLHTLKHLVDRYEKHSQHPVSIDNMTPDYVKKQMNGVVGFEITITNIEAAYKLSQNHDAINHEAIVNELEKRSDDASHQVAEAMKKDFAKRQTEK